MSPAAFLDTNVPIYATGGAHQQKAPCLRVMDLAARHPRAFVTDVEVLQELMHRYLSSGRWSLGREVISMFAEVMRNRIEPVHVSDMRVASALADDHPGIGARDLLHASVMQRLGLERIISADRDFDRLPGVIRLDPSTVDEWEGSVLNLNGGPDA